LKRYVERVVVEEGVLDEVDAVVVEVRSARRPKKKVKVLMRRPIMVRNWRCQPKDSFYENQLLARQGKFPGRGWGKACKVKDAQDFETPERCYDYKLKQSLWCERARNVRRY
jgi:hypothetical protein